MEKYIKIINIIDNSGSMGSMIDTAINGFNEFLIEQQKVEGKAVVTTVLFNTKYEKLYEDLDINECYSLNKTNYITGGMTALYDAIGRTIQDEIDKLGNIPKEERPEKYLCIILTDGYENCSKLYDNDKIKSMINEMREDFNWEFIFLAANEDASLTAQTMGISKGNSYSFANTEDGLRDAYMGINYASTNYRSFKSSKKNDNLMDDYSNNKNE